jgi:NitT/TauT family transport system substrate-binding protein
VRFFRSVVLSVLALVPALAAPVRAADLPVINLIALPSSTSGEVYYAQDMGFFRDAGIDVHITPMTSSPAIISALVSGSADIGFAAIGVGASARERGIPMYFVAPGQVYVPSSPTSALAGLTDTTIKTAQDLVGKTVGVTGIADLSFFTTESWLEKNGVARASVKFVEIPFAEMSGALAQHRIDAAVIAEPFLTQAKNVKIIADVNGGLAKNFMLAGWIAAEPWIRAHPDAVARFQVAIKRTAAWANVHRKEAGDILLRYLKMDPEVAATMRMPQFALTLDPALLQPPIDATSKYLTHKPPMVASDLVWQTKP